MDSFLKDIFMMGASKGVKPPMTKAAESRQEAAQRIADNAKLYKLCEGCGSILSNSAAGNPPICPNCHSYRFDEDPETVARAAIELGARDQESVTGEDMQ
jgi:NADH pyrophosphatase NudC (nudix superfamily)